MDIAKLSSELATAKTIQNAQIGMLKKAIDQMEQTGAQIVEMINETMVSTDSVIDVKI